MSGRPSSEVLHGVALCFTKHPEHDRNYYVHEAAAITGVDRTSIMRSKAYKLQKTKDTKMDQKIYVQRALTKLAISAKLKDDQLHQVSAYLAQMTDAQLVAARENPVDYDTYATHYAPKEK